MKRRKVMHVGLLALLLFLLAEGCLLALAWHRESGPWTALGAMATAIYTVVFTFTVAILGWQINELRRATSAQTLSTIWDKLAGMRSERTTLFRHLRNGVSVSTETAHSDDVQEMKEVAVTLANAYEDIGAMIRYGYLEAEVLVPNHANSIRMIWRAALPLTDRYRGRVTDVSQTSERRMGDFWRNFEWLSREAWQQGQRIGDIPSDLAFPATEQELIANINEYDKVTLPG